MTTRDDACTPLPTALATPQVPRLPALGSVQHLLLLLAFAFTVMADPISSVAYAIEAALRALDGQLALLLPTIVGCGCQMTHVGNGMKLEGALSVPIGGQQGAERAIRSSEQELVGQTAA